MSSLKSLNIHLLCMKGLGFFNPFVGGGGNGRHGEDHGGNLLVDIKRELIDKGDVVSNPSLAGEILKVCDIFLKSIICDFIRAVDGLFNNLERSRQAVALVSKG